MLIKPPLVVIVGPTGSGKSDLAMNLAESFHGEIVSADSRQVYRGLDIGTDKVPVEHRNRVPHHLLDMAEPTDTFTLALFQKAAIRAIEHIQGHGLLPFLVGGTGLYIKSVVDNLQVPPVPPQPELRKELEKLDLEKLRQRLKASDPVGYENIDLHNPRRLIRAIEVSETAGIPFSQLQTTGEPLFDTLQIGIRLPAAELERKITERMTWRLKRGLVKEVKSLHDSGVSWEQLESFGLEYRRFAEHLQGKHTLESATEQAQKDLLAFAKRQQTWFRRDKRILWIDDPAIAEDAISNWLTARASNAEGAAR